MNSLNGAALAAVLNIEAAANEAAIMVFETAFILDLLVVGFVLAVF